ncbi:MAG: DUF6544 family protein [Ilumatobacteraceae bacterium]
MSLIIGSLLALIGLGLLAGGAILGWAVGTQRDDAGYFSTRHQSFETTGYALTSDKIDLGEPGPSEFGDWANAVVQIRVDTARQGDVFVGIGASADVEAYLAGVPAPVAAYICQSGAIGRPRITSFRADISGRIRSGPTKPWMTFTGEQVNTFGANPSRSFRMDATMAGLPVDVLHIFADATASMRVRVCSLYPMVNSSGPDMDRAETVTVFNDLCVLAPGAIVDAPITWRTIDDHRTQGTFTDGPHIVTAELTFNDQHQLVDFWSDDRMMSSSDGRTLASRRWSTPITAYRTIHDRCVATFGEALWHAPSPEGPYTYLEFNLDDINYNVTPSVE